MTGTVLPNGCNVVIMKEEIENISKDSIKIHSENIKKKQNIKVYGEDIKPNRVLIKKNQSIDPSIMGLMASQGINKVKVYKKPKFLFYLRR